MEACPRPECDCTLVVQRIKGDVAVTCRACGRHPSSPPVALTPSRDIVQYVPPWGSRRARRLKSPKSHGKKRRGFTGNQKVGK